MRKLLTPVLLLPILALPKPVHAVQETAPLTDESSEGAEICERSEGGSVIRCKYEYDFNNPGSTPSGGGGSSGSTQRYVRYDRLVTGPDGQPCITTGYYAAGSQTPSDEAPTIVPGSQAPGDNFSPGYETYPPCPAQEGQPVAVTETPAAFAARFWERVPLPKPKPYIAPGWAITGKLAYLETNGETRHTYTSSTPFGPLEIVATGRYYVDWGDGETSGPHSVEGKPWPDGQITHEYIWARTYDIVVTERWTATWSLGGRSGVLRELRTTGTIDDFVARQIQAVVR